MRPYRREKMTSTIRSFMGAAIRDHVNDPRVDPLTTVTRVELSADLLSAKIYVITHGKPSVMRRSLAGLQHASGHLQRLLAAHLQVRQCPRISFELDEAFLTAEETLRLIANNRAGRPADQGSAGDADNAASNDVEMMEPAGDGGTELSEGSDR